MSDTKEVVVKIPAGIDDGATLRVSGFIACFMYCF